MRRPAGNSIHFSAAQIPEIAVPPTKKSNLQPNKSLEWCFTAATFLGHLDTVGLRSLRQVCLLRSESRHFRSGLFLAKGGADFKMEHFLLGRGENQVATVQEWMPASLAEGTNFISF